MLGSLFILLSSIPLVLSWPDGAPCVHAAFESMNPLEAVEHQGGLQLSVPPYEIAIDQKCYWRNQPIGLTLQGLNESVFFKGFVIQPFKWNNDQLGNRIGQLVRLDDNGSWQQQCFRFKDSATHSHDEKKKHIKMWWKNDDELDTVQFVATVVKHQTMFWVKSVRSRPIPPCRLNRDGFPSYRAPLPTVPPPVKQFKMETFRVFDSIGAETLDQTLHNQPQPSPIATSPTMTKIIPVVDGFQRGSASFSAQVQTSTAPPPLPATVQTTTFRPIPARPRQQIVAQQPSPAFRRRGQSTFRQSSSFSSGTCIDRDPQNRCPQWRQFCRSPSHQRYLSTFCARTCQFCR
ncbi:unnamed protein product [Caenorhabditis bovis]|uniref:ShKT domain-containing protein n=1 Tax=Caenorhabditis bovis TaxID=2654633 RepID=A0A8S1E9E0_9PELO|nr:unnamed protein product [Caenorhabditis bovis]